MHEVILLKIFRDENEDHTLQGRNAICKNSL